MIFGFLNKERDKALADDMAEATASGRSLTAMAVNRFTRNRVAMGALGVLIILTLMAIFAPVVTPHRYDFQDCARSNRLTCLPEFEGIKDPPRIERRYKEENYADLDFDTFRQQLYDYRPATPKFTKMIDQATTKFELLQVLKEFRDQIQGGELKPFQRANHLLGTGQNGRDMYSMTIYGMRMSIAVAVVAAIVALMIGVIYGAVAGFVGGALDAGMMRVVDVLYSYPLALLAVVAMGYTGEILNDHPDWKVISIFGAEFPTRIVIVFAVIGAVEWLLMARIVRGQVMSLRQSDFIEAARATGVGLWGQIFRHIVPNVVGIVVVYVTLIIPEVVVVEAFLAFLGLGVQDPQVSLGTLVDEGADAIQRRFWWLMTPGIILVLLLLSFNFVGDGLRDAFDPKER